MGSARQAGATTLAYRRPAALWMSVGLVLAPVIGVAPFLAMRAYTLSTSPLWGGEHEWIVRDIQQNFASTAAFAIAVGVIASVLMGAPWAVLTRRRRRRWRAMIVAEVVGLGFAFPYVLAAIVLATRFFTIGPESGWDAAWRSLDNGLVIGWSVLISAATFLVTPMSGLALSLIAFERRAEGPGAADDKAQDVPSALWQAGDAKAT